MIAPTDVARAYVGYKCVQVTIDATVGGKGFLPADLISPQGFDCRYAELFVESGTEGTDALRYVTGATVPTASLGVRIFSGQKGDIFGIDNLRNFRAIRTTAVSVTLTANLYY